MSDTVIKAENLSKKYTIGHQQTERYTALRDVIANGARRMFNRGIVQPWKRLSSSTALQFNNSTEEFFALRDVSFEIKQGDRVGIIGRNGAGKSTLLKILSRITEPSSGRITLKGRVASLLEVGTGFHPELTGRENIFLNGAIMGMSKAEIKKKFDEIVAFAEVEKFLDTPVKRYSSGMYVRLAFAVAAHLDTEILLVDEVLAVGDAQFQKKCLGKMEEVGARGRTVLFVSHNMGAINSFCTKGILIDSGKIKLVGKVEDVVNKYLKNNTDAACELLWKDVSLAPGDDVIRLKAVRVTSEGKSTANVAVDKDTYIEIEFWNLRLDIYISTSIHLLHESGVVVFASGNGISSTLKYDGWFGKPHPIGVFKSVYKIPANFLNEGTYTINAIVLTDATNIHARKDEAVQFYVYDTGEMRKEYTGKWIGVARPKLEWITTYESNLK
jgi:lipopolysaccharide transport system ATP-binding protein